MPGGPGGMGGMMGGPNMSHGNVMGGHVDSYSMSQTQTINFTQQTLRRGAGPGGMFLFFVFPTMPFYLIN